MPPHKNKKKGKKSYRHLKKDISSSSEDNSISWKIRCSTSDSEQSDGLSEDLLSTFVRKSYTKHLQQALSKNFEEWVESCDEECKYKIQELVIHWTSMIEQKTLRTSLKSELYRRGMVCVIKQIKESTSKGQCYITQKDLSRMKKKLPLSKATQTEILVKEKKCCVAETQTDPPLSSLLEVTLLKSNGLSPNSRPYDPAIEFSDSQSVSSTQPNELNSINQDICKISSTSDLFQPYHCSEIDVKMDESFIHDSFSTAISSKTGSTKMNIQNSSTQDIMSIVSTCGNSSGTREQFKTFPTTLRKSERTNETDDLNARLTEMGLLSDTENDNTLSKISRKYKKSNWFAEEIAQSCNLTRILLRMSSRQRERVLLRIKELFGDNDEPLAELTEENINVCRKRIASVVVMELTQLYQAKRIASRSLFKFLAKKITKSIMDQSYAPDTRSIRWKVKDFFSDGKIIMSESDCY